jgi:hypothetical protein
MQWPRLLAYITGRVDKELLVRNEYLAAENRILRAKIKGRLQLSDGEKRSLAEIAHRLGRKALAEVAAETAARNKMNLDLSTFLSGTRVLRASDIRSLFSPVSRLNRRPRRSRLAQKPAQQESWTLRNIRQLRLRLFPRDIQGLGGICIVRIESQHFAQFYHSILPPAEPA